MSAEPSRRYRLSQGLMRFAANDAYLIEGGPRAASFVGPGALDVLPELCDLLDGSRSVPELAFCLGVAVSDIAAALELLWREGLVELCSDLADAKDSASGPLNGSTVRVEAGPDAGQPHMMAFLSRSAGFTGRAENGRVLATNLIRARVLLAGEGALADRLRDGLVDSGLTVDSYSASLLAEVADANNHTQPSAMVVQVIDPALPRPAETLTMSYQHGVAWLGLGSTSRRGYAGPMLHRDWSCLTCALVAVQARAQTGQSMGPHDECVTAVGEVVAALAVAEVVNGLSGVASVNTVNQWITVGSHHDDESISVGRERLYRAMTCDGCRRPGDDASSGPLMQARSNVDAQRCWAYEQEIEQAPPAFSAPAEFRRPLDTRSLEGRARSLPTCPAVPISAWAGEDDERRRIGQLLDGTLGIREVPDDLPPRRMIASAGNLGSVQAFLIDRDRIRGLGSHAAWYDERQQRLVAAGRVSGAEVREAVAAMVPGSDWHSVVVWVGAVGAVAWKYDDFALRLTQLDAGVALMHATMFAYALRLRPRLAAGWDATTLAALLSLDPTIETITSVMFFEGHNHHGC